MLCQRPSGSQTPMESGGTVKLLGRFLPGTDHFSRNSPARRMILRVNSSKWGDACAPLEPVSLVGISSNCNLSRIGLMARSGARKKRLPLTRAKVHLQPFEHRLPVHVFLELFE